MKPKVVVATIVTVVLLGAVGFIGYGFLFSSAADDAVTLVPEDSIGYFNIFLSPSNSQKRALESLIEKTPFESPEEAIERFTNLADEGLKEQGCTFEEDIDPWLGKQVAGFLSEIGDEGSGAILIASDDDEAALASLEKCGDEEFQNSEERSYEGYDYRAQPEGTPTGAVGIVEGYLVLGTEDAFKDVVDTAAGGSSLQDSEKFDSALEPLNDDRLALFYLDFKALIDQMVEQGQAEASEIAAFETYLGGATDQPLSAGLFARSDAVVLEYAAGLPTGEDAGGLLGATEDALRQDILGQLPGGSWGALAVGSVGNYIDQILGLADQFQPGGRAFLEAQFERQTGLSLNEDVLSWMGDLGAFVQGTTPDTLSGGVVLETDDEAAALTAVRALEAFARREKAPVKPLGVPGFEGFSLQDPFQPQPINVAVGNGRVVFAYGDLATEQALEADVTLEEQSETFGAATEALGEDFSMSGFFEADAIQGLVESSVLPTLTTYDPASGQVIPNTEAQDRYENDIKPFIDPLSFIAFGSRIEDGTTTTRMVVGVE